jgi:glyoxylase-like metal-dependent hydrolase (beta-lactamase superfamily II)
MLQWTAATTFAVALRSIPLFAADDANDSPIMKMFGGKLEVTDLGDGLHLVANGGGNVLISSDADGILVIDTGMSFRARDYLAVAASLAPNAKRKIVFNTHWHMDHTGGNADFAAAGFVIAGSENCRKRMGEKITMEDMGMTTDPSPETARPVMTFQNSMDLFEGSAAHIVKIAPAHTDGDAIVLFAKGGVLHTGDLHFNGTYPVIDRSTNGSLDGMTAATKKLLELSDDKTRVVPGHGALTDKKTLAAQLELLILTHDRLAPLGEKKMTMDEVVTKAPLADLDDKWGRGFLRSPVYTRMAYGQWLTAGK